MPSKPELGTVSVRKARNGDIVALKTIADANRDALGFLPRPKLEDATKASRIFVAVVQKKVIGFVIFRHRKTDLQTTISDICVAADWRGYGVGKTMFEKLKEDTIHKKRAFIRLKCPVDMASNGFYKYLGFNCVNVEKGRIRQLNVWQFDLVLEKVI